MSLKQVISIQILLWFNTIIKSKWRMLQQRTYMMIWHRSHALQHKNSAISVARDVKPLLSKTAGSAYVHLDHMDLAGSQKTFPVDLCRELHVPLAAALQHENLHTDLQSTQQSTESQSHADTRFN